MGATVGNDMCRWAGRRPDITSLLLDNLDGALMGSFLATDGRWLFLADLVLARLSHEDQIGRYGRNTQRLS